MPDQEFICSDELAFALGISARKARAGLKKRHAGGTWRGVRLDVLIGKERGGRGGLVYLVRKDSIPPAFFKGADVGAFEEDEATAEAETAAVAIPEAATPAVSPPTLPLAVPRQTRHFKASEVDFKRNLIQRIRQETDPGTQERAKLIETLAQSERFPYGAKRGQLVGASTLRRWVRDYEQDGLRGISRRARADDRKSRVLISRRWDAAVKQLGLSGGERQELAKPIRRRVASPWRSGVPSWPTVQMNVLAFAMQQLRKAGCTLSAEALRPICQISRPVIEAERHYRAAAIYRQDAAHPYMSILPSARGRIPE